MTTIVPTTPEVSTLLLFGAGGHARVVADAALLTPAWRHVLACDRDPARCVGELLPDVPLLPLLDAGRIDTMVHVAIGNNAAREREAAFWGHERLVTVVHPQAVLSPFARLEAGCFVAAGAIVGPGARVGPGTIINHAAIIDHDVQVGAFSHIAPHATLGGAVGIGRRVLVGAGAVVLPGVTVADDVVIGAGAVVREALLEPGTYVGVPARRVQ
ncbi:MAG: acetyltransferase [Burkholderiaceae bacterium]